MKEGLFEVLLFELATHRPLPERVLDGVTYVIAEPGCEYYVQVSMHRLNNKEKWEYDFIRVGLLVDGFDVQYWKRLDFTDPTIQDATVLHAKFWGFKEDSEKFRTFVMTDPHQLPTTTTTTTTTTTNDTTTIATATTKTQLGKIKVVIHEAVLTDGMFENKCGAAAAPSLQDTTTTAATNTNTKFWMQASVGTKAGSALTGKDIFKPIARWENKSTLPTQTLLLTYQSKLSYDLFERFTHYNKRAKHNHDPIDLTGDNDDDEDNGNNNNKNGSSNNNNNNSREEEEVLLVNVPKLVPLLDISDDNNAPVWSSKTL